MWLPSLMATQVKPVAISLEDAWIPVPECSLPDRSATSCRIAWSSLERPSLNRGTQKYNYGLQRIFSFYKALCCLCCRSVCELESYSLQVGLQTYTSYDLRVQETCIHNTSNSWRTQIAEALQSALPTSRKSLALSRHQTTDKLYRSGVLIALRSILAGWEFLYHSGKARLVFFWTAHGTTFLDISILIRIRPVK